MYDSISGSRAPRLFTREALVLKRGSVGQDEGGLVSEEGLDDEEQAEGGDEVGGEMASLLQRIPKSLSLPPPIRIAESWVAKLEYGTMEGCEVPHRPESRSPDTRTLDAMLLRVATWQSERERSR